jgi:hypothetical protein
MKVMPFAVLLLLASFAVAREKPPYEVGTFMSSRQVSDGTYSTASCGTFGCNGSAYNAAHNVHLVSTPDGIFSIEAPVSVAGTILLGIASNGNAPTVHKAWFMDDLHEGDKVLFSAQCGKHGRCTIRLPDPDKPNKEIRTLGFFYPAVAKTNTTVLCGTGRLTADVEAQICDLGNSPSQPAAESPLPPVSQELVPAVGPVEPPNVYENTNVAARQRAPEISATPVSPPTLSPEPPQAVEADTRRKLTHERGNPAKPEASMVSRYWGMPERPITSAPWEEPGKPFVPVEPISQYWDGTRFSREFFSGTYGKRHVFAINGPATVWTGTPFKIHSSFCQGVFCFTLFDSIPSYWLYNELTYTYIDETCVANADSDDLTCTYFLYNADHPAQRVLIFVVEA